MPQAGGRTGVFIHFDGGGKRVVKYIKAEHGREKQGKHKRYFLGIIIPSWYLTSVRKGFDIH